MVDAQAVIITVLIIKNSKKEIAINNKIQRVHSFESFCKILSDIHDGGKDAITTEVHVLSSAEREEEAMVVLMKLFLLPMKYFL